MSLINRMINNPVSTRGFPSLLNTDPFSLMNQQLQMMQRPFFDLEQTSLIPFDVRETSKAYIVHADVPGMLARSWLTLYRTIGFSKDQITIDSEGQVLNVRGSWEKEKDETNEQYWFRERSRSSFNRSITLNSAFDASKINAELINGVLTINVPKVNSSSPARKIMIK